jgi:hypothetical protein
MHRTITETTSMNTEIQTVGLAIIVQTVVRYAALFALAWLALSFVDGWVMSYLAQS